MTAQTRTPPTADRLTGSELIKHWTSREGKHREAGVCPACSQDLIHLAIVKLAYTFETCACGKPEYRHLVEQLWHLTCLKTIDLR